MRVVLAFLFRHWKRERWLVAGVALGMSFATIADLFMPVFAGRIVDAVAVSHGTRSQALLTAVKALAAMLALGGVLVAGDRRATSGNVMVYDRADKVLEIDRYSLMAIAGSPAIAWEMARVLSHSFQFYRRTQLQEMSVPAKVAMQSTTITE